MAAPRAVRSVAMPINRTPKYHKGRWQIQRERCRLPDEKPPPPRVETEGIARTINRVLEQIGVESQPTATRLEREWVQCVGHTIASHTRPAQLQANAELLIFVDSSVWYSELTRMRQQLLANIRKHLGNQDVRDVRLRLDPDGSERARTGKFVSTLFLCGLCAFARLIFFRF